ncbi:Uncharacterized conserved protein, DUF305 family [Thermomonospora echinospora]|uniref:Uncharacterized conserved protein, DUF305 family n=1 Tax=Thermomonospora echinospora TaxID=1992 RepID=A0A1H6DTX0_9ACTN|nr:DUF305 domain-containing protein [Thermomonospora echinospora]SEG88156.1 Uncharacterized conserved protein, DUF305 family [Thermomonospora echinospora]
MSRRHLAGRVLSAAGLMVIGAVAAMLLLGAGRAADRAPIPAAGPVDVGFSQDMIAHHQQAVTMAQTVRGRVSPPVAQLASSIELNQTREIGQLQGWLMLWNAPQVPSGPPMTWMAADRAGHSGHRRATDADVVMPGMASQQEVNRLGELTGEDADAWFLQLMIRHHQGGLAMTTAAARDATSPQVRALATLMTTEQHKEVATMAGLLDALGRRPLPAPTSHR